MMPCLNVFPVLREAGPSVGFPGPAHQPWVITGRQTLPQSRDDPWAVLTLGELGWGKLWEH